MSEQTVYELARKEAEPDRPDYFHGCSHCPVDKGADNIYNAGRLHVGACHAHKTVWTIGSNLFSGWKDETEEQQRERYREIEGYEDVSSRTVPF